MRINASGLLVTLQNRIFNLVSLDNGAKMSPKLQTLLSLIFACTCLTKLLLIRIRFLGVKNQLAHKGSNLAQRRRPKR